MKSLFLPLMVLLIFQGCSSKQVKMSTQNYTDETIIANPIEKTKSSTRFSSGFEDEFSDEKEIQPDPLKTYNEVMTSFNDVIFTYALNPVSKAYAYVIPEPLRLGVANVIHNIQYPVRLANNLLQGKFENASEETERFIVNTTLGVAGLFDPASTYKKLPKHNEDFGQTLGHYGVGSGFHIVLPFLGPSNVRDVVGISVDAYASPLVNVRGLENYKIPKNFVQSTAIVAGYYVNKTSLELGNYESLKKDALELYPFLRNIYEQKRIAEIEE